ncbi:MAG TPA: M23 family metallopeptidase [Candidatus Acidoferrum sp.]|nr:M23 family metallopeptidase [Candidatus Acidoferrum sp.]
MNSTPTRCISPVFASPALLACLFLIAAPAPASQCPYGVELRLSAPEAAQGSLLLAELRSPQPLRDVAAKWNDRDVPFWKPELHNGEPPPHELHKAVLGVDLEKPAGQYQLTVSATEENGQRFTCSAQVQVRAGHFATESLTVKNEFVEPNSQQLARAEADTKKLRAIYDRVTSEKLWDGEFRIPLDGVVHGVNFGRRRVLNGHPGSPHGGVDFPSPTGTPVHASQRGRVVLAEDLFFSGNTVVVDHGLGIYTFYCHFSEINVTVGQSVNAGDVLGKVGATGRVTGPHLHWGLSVEHARVNALDIVKLPGIS